MVVLGGARYVRAPEGLESRKRVIINVEVAIAVRKVEALREKASCR